MIDLSLGRIERLLAALGHPERALPPVIHVAGTNGKGSLVAYLQAILQAAGYRVHTYTSPHLVHFTERIVLGGRPIADDDLCDLLLACETANAGRPITFFEITTAAAFLAFSRYPADALILETGLGGRLDATNVVDTPALTAITPVSIDHVDFLGETIAAIAGEKAGILKPGVPAVIGPQHPDALAVIGARAEAVDAPLALAGTDWQVEVFEDGVWRFRGLDRDLTLPNPVLHGRHQIDNAATAVACTTLLPDFTIDAGSIAEGLTSVRHGARLQRLSRGPLIEAAGPLCEIWLDGGHNVAAGEALAAAVRELWRDRPLDLVLGIMGNKDAAGFLRPFVDAVRRLRTVAIPGHDKAADPEVLAAMARHLGIQDAAAAANLTDAATPVRDGTPSRTLICGSLYLAGHILTDHA